MKNLLFTLVLLFSLHSFGQFINAPVERAVILKAAVHTDVESAIYVPEGMIWQFTGGSDGSSGTPFLDYVGVILDEITIQNELYGNLTFPEGTGFYSFSSNTNDIWTFIEYNLDNQGLSYNNPNLDNKIRLFPNPTTSEVALNSDKQYDIEVYDILGNKVMELTGNTIDMEHLSSATYIVNALDTETNEILSYKVIKN